MRFGGLHFLNLSVRAIAFDNEHASNALQFCEDTDELLPTPETAAL